MMQKQKYIRLYQNFTLYKDAEFILSAQAAHYVKNVMRLGSGHRFLAFNGNDGEWEVVIVHDNRREVLCRVLLQTRICLPEPELVLVFAPLKPHRQATLVEKATELGVTRLVPVLTQHSSIRAFNREKTLLQVIEAAEQSGRISVPCIDELGKMTDFLEKWDPDYSLYMADERRTAPGLLKCWGQDIPGRAAFLVGPEGGFSEEEFSLLEKISFVRNVSLGERILRSETAGIVLLSLFQGATSALPSRNSSAYSGDTAREK